MENKVYTEYDNELKGSVIDMPVYIREGEILTVEQMKEKLSLMN